MKGALETGLFFAIIVACSQHGYIARGVCEPVTLAHTCTEGVEDVAIFFFGVEPL